MVTMKMKPTIRNGTKEEKRKATGKEFGTKDNGSKPTEIRMNQT